MASTSSAVRSQFDNRAPSRGGPIDGRTLAARRRKELIETYATSLGGLAGLSEGQRVDVRRAAELVALAEAERAKALRGEPVDLSALIRVEGAADRAVRRLGIKPGANQPKPESIAEYAARRAREKAAGSAGGSPA